MEYDKCKMSFKHVWSKKFLDIDFVSNIFPDNSDKYIYIVCWTRFSTYQKWKWKSVFIIKVNMQNYETEEDYSITDEVSFDRDYSRVSTNQEMLIHL